MTERGFRTATIEQLEATDGWSAIRRHFGVRSFGVNAWTAREVGGTLIGEHDEEPSGHEELYLVVAGRAAFTVGGEEVDAPAGTFVYVREPSVTRKAVAREVPATVLAIGGAPGQAYEPRAWETNAEVLPLFERGQYAEAKRILQDALDDYDDDAGVLYNLACAEARLGERDAALEHLAAAVARQARFAGYARTDEDLASLRADPRFPS